MTIKQTIKITSDVSQKNDVLFLDRALLNCPLSAATMISNFESISSSKIAALNYIDNVVKEKLPEFEPWLLVGHAAWQADTKIMRHKKLWTNLDRLGLRISDGERIGEQIVESQKGIKFFDAVKCKKFSPDEVVALLREVKAGVLIYVKNDEALKLVKEFLSTGWEKDNFFVSSMFLNAACSSNLLICCLLGNFDDVESGCAVLGRRETIQQCFSADDQIAS